MTASLFAAAVLAFVTAWSAFRSRRAVAPADPKLPARLRRAASPIDPRRRAA